MAIFSGGGTPPPGNSLTVVCKEALACRKAGKSYVYIPENITLLPDPDESQGEPVAFWYETDSENSILTKINNSGRRELVGEYVYESDGVPF